MHREITTPTREEVVKYLDQLESLFDQDTLRDIVRRVEWTDPDEVMKSFEEPYMFARHIVSATRDLLEGKVDRESGRRRVKELADSLIKSSIELLDVAVHRAVCPHCFTEFYTDVLFGFLMLAKEYSWLADHLEEVS